MQLPFSREAFLDVFGAYNAAFWPAATALWIVTALVAFKWLRGRAGARAVLALMAVHWAVSGVFYHWLFFRAINPTATMFGAFFVLQALLFSWLAVASKGRFAPGRRPRGILGAALVVYGLAYPLLGLGFGLDYPRVPLFAVPCPTTLVTAGLLVTGAGVPPFANIVPLLWAVVGSSAAFALGIRADLALVVAGVVLGLDTIAPTALGSRAGA